MSKITGSTNSSDMASKQQILLSEEASTSTDIESSDRLIRSPAANISIGRMYVYNFSPPRDQQATSIEITIPPKAFGKFHSPATSSGAFCRICHEGDTVEDLISPCHCAGTVGLVHMSCMERWLSLAGSDKCEICNYMFITIRSPRGFLEWLRSTRIDSESRRSLVSDSLCFLLLTPLAGVSSFLCVEGAKKQILEGNSLEAGCLMALATFLITIYLIWNVLTCRFHAKTFFKWRVANQRVKVVRVRRLSSGNLDGALCTDPEVVVHVEGESTSSSQQHRSYTGTQGNSCTERAAA